MRLTDAGASAIVGRLDNVPERLPPGRGFAVGTPPREFQVALLPDDVEAATEMAAASASTAELFAQLRAPAGDIKPPAAQHLPTRRPLDHPPPAPPPVAGRPPGAL